jgi:hypothetical protein
MLVDEIDPVMIIGWDEGARSNFRTVDISLLWS